MRRRTTWIIWATLTWLGGAGLVFALGWAKDRSMFLPGRTTHGHYQIEMACSECHTPWGGVSNDACNRCHATELAAVNDSHPLSKFQDPRNAELLKKLDASKCVTCHREHRPQVTGDLGVTQPVDYCYNCHKTIGDERKSHRGLAFTTCQTAGCHNYHDNSALYEEFIGKHLGEPKLLPVAAVPVRAVVSAPATAPQPVFPASVKLGADTVADWLASAHARAGVGCVDCHQGGEAAAAWVEKPDQKSCARCHQSEVDGFLGGRHGMRLAAGLGPMSPALARLPMKASAAHLTLSCQSCHGAHRYDTREAAVSGCLGCHDDGHSRSFTASPHYAFWQAEMEGKAAPGTGVSCATCHLPREEVREAGATVVRVQHNQNLTLRPDERQLRPVCMRCHGYTFSVDALAEQALIDANFPAAPTQHVASSDWVQQRQKNDPSHRKE